MLQRPQTLFLSLVILGMCVFLAFPIWENTNLLESIRLSAFSLAYRVGPKGSPLTEDTSVAYLAGLAILAIVLAGGSITQYSNRLRQMLFNLGNSLVLAGLLVAVMYCVFIKSMQPFSGGDGTFQPGFWGLLVALASNVIANRFIRSDEKKVKDAFERFR